MIETVIPKINIDELMQRVRVEAAKLRSGGGRGTHAVTRTRGSTLPAVRVLPPPPRSVLLKPVDAKRERLDGMLREAQAKSDGNSRVPKMFRRFFRKQGGYNRLLIDSVALLGKTTAQLAKRVTELSTSIEPQNRWLRALAEYRQSDVNWMRAATQELTSLREEVSELRAQLEQLHEELQTRGSSDAQRGIRATQPDDSE